MSAQEDTGTSPEVKPDWFEPEASSKVTHALTAPKQPPPETPEEIRTRRLVIASFWVVVIFLGLPIWWKTTTIYRANLPLQVMNEWAEGKVCRPVFPLPISVEAPELPQIDALHLLRTTQHAIDDLNEFSAHHLRLLLSEQSGANKSQETVSANGNRDVLYSRSKGENAALTIRLLPGETGSTPRSELKPYSPTLDIYYSANQIPHSSSTSSPLATFVANELQKIYEEEQAMLAYLLSKSSTAHGSKIKSLSPETTAALERQSTRAFKYAPTYHLTFSLFTPTSTPSAWEIETALQEYMAPLLASLSSISNFTVDTQVQLYAQFAPSIRQPEYDPGLQAWTLRKEDLPGFINAAEWPLSPSIGAGPTINFVLYVPDAKQTPLLVKESGANSWLVPQWGGVMILNPPSDSNPSFVDRDALRPAMATFSTQLLTFLGLPHTPASLPLRLSTLTRVRSASLLFSASSTLGALARLTEALPSISIPDAVAESVNTAIEHLNLACHDLRDGRFHGALENARTAEREAEKAFFEPSMVGQVYFPDEHKVAVYLPLLGPVAVPMIMAALSEVKRLAKKKKNKAQ